VEKKKGKRKKNNKAKKNKITQDIRRKLFDHRTAHVDCRIDREKGRPPKQKSFFDENL
jgi:hypothetical protein